MDTIDEIQNLEYELTNTCPECSSSKIDIDHKHGEVVCSQCSLVIRDGLIDNRRPRVFSSDQYDKKIHDAPSDEFRHDKGLGSFIGYDKYNSTDPTLMNRLRKINNGIKYNGTSPRNVRHAMKEIEKLSFKENIPDTIKQRAMKIYKDATEKNLIKGRSIDSVAGASLYLACKEVGYYRNPKDLAPSVKKGRRSILRTSRSLMKELGITGSLVDTERIITKLCSDLNCPDYVQNRSLEIYSEIEENISGKRPSCIAASIIYTVSKEYDDFKITQNKLASASGVTEVSIRTNYKSILKLLDQIEEE